MMQNWKGDQVYWFAGIAAVTVYLVGVTVGGMLYPGYSHITQDVSQLTSSESPIRIFMNAVFWPYNIFVSIFGLGLYKLNKGRLSHIGAVSVILIGILGLLIALFPIDTRGTALSMRGLIHIAIVSVVALLTVASGFLFYKGFAGNRYAAIARLSLVSSVGFLIFGPIAAVTVTSPYAGLTERIPIGIFLLWILAMSITLLRDSQSTHKYNYN